jgi:uncharacterized protein
MDERQQKIEMVEYGAIIEIRSGSHLYGTSVPTSDEDKIGIFIAPERYYLGLDHIEEVDLGHVSKGEDGKNLPDAIDRKFYELRKFVTLAKDGNPNILEILFVDVKNVLSINEWGIHLLEHASMFPTQEVRPKYLGYALGQKKQMVNKPENYKQTVMAQKYLELLEEEMTTQQFHRTRVAAKLEDMVRMGVAEDKLTHISIGKANYCTSTTLGKLNNLLLEKMNKITSRQELWTKYGYDTKFGAHLIRLLTEGIEVLTTGKIEFPLHNRDLLLSIRNGNYTKEEVLEMAEMYEEELKVVHSDLPMEQNKEQVNALLIDMVKSWYANDAYNKYLTI